MNQNQIAKIYCAECGHEYEKEFQKDYEKELDQELQLSCSKCRMFSLHNKIRDEIKKEFETQESYMTKIRSLDAQAKKLEQMADAMRKTGDVNNTVRIMNGVTIERVEEGE